MTARILEILQNTYRAIANSVNGEDQGPYAYHNFSRGFCRFDGETNRGSFVLELTTWKETMEFLQSLDWVEMSEQEAIDDGDQNADGKVSEYFRATLPKSLTGYSGGNIFKNLSPEAQARVEEVEGYHGPEFQINNASIEDFAQTTELRLIVSKKNHPYNKSGMDILATWFPGVLAPPSAFMSGRKEIAKEERFVKLVL